MPQPFKPPRPSAITKKAALKPKSTTARKSTDRSAAKPAKPKARVSGSTSFSRPSIASSLALDASDSDDPFASDPELEPEFVNVDMEGDEDHEPTESIPAALLTRLMHECFKEEGTRIGKDANAAVAKYMDTFVRETLARVAHLRREINEGAAGFLEVEDLEKIAPQVMLDF